MDIDRLDGHNHDFSTSKDPMELLAMAAAQAAASNDTSQPMQACNAWTPQEAHEMSAGPSIDIQPSTEQSTRGMRGKSVGRGRGRGRPRGSRGKRGTAQGVDRGRGATTQIDSTEKAPEVATEEGEGGSDQSAESSSVHVEEQSFAMDLDPLPSDQTLERRPQPLAIKPVYKKRVMGQVQQKPPVTPTAPTSASTSSSLSAPAIALPFTSLQQSDGLIRRRGVESWQKRQMGGGTVRQEYQRPRPMNAYDLSTMRLEKKLTGASMRKKRSKKGSSQSIEAAGVGMGSPRQQRPAGEALARHQSAMLDKIEKLYTRPLPQRDVVRMLQMELDAEEQTLQQMEERLRQELTRLKVEEEVLLEMLQMSIDVTMDASMYSRKSSQVSERIQRPSAADTAAVTTAAGPVPFIPPKLTNLSALTDRPQQQQPLATMPPPLSLPKPLFRKRQLGVRVSQEPPMPALPVLPNLHKQTHTVPGPATSTSSAPKPITPARIMPQSEASAAHTTTRLQATASRLMPRPMPVSISTSASTQAPTPVAASALPALEAGGSDSSLLAALNILQHHEEEEERRKQEVDAEDEDEEDEGETEDESSSEEESGDEDEDEEGEDYHEDEEEDEDAARSALRSMLAEMGTSPF